jgi:hypothetical protein
MSTGRADRALRRAIADLAILRSDDISAILDALDADERSRVQRLLHAYTGRSNEISPADAVTDLVAAGLSLWLVECLEKSCEGHKQSMTSGARAALKDCAHALFAPAANGGQPQKSGLSLFGRIESLFVREGSSA